MRVSGVTKYPLATGRTLVFSPRMQGNTSLVIPARGGGRRLGWHGRVSAAAQARSSAGLPGNTGYGALAGVVVGLPAGVFAVYRRFKGYFT